MKENQVLEKTYRKSKQLMQQKSLNSFDEIIQNDINILIDNIEKNKSLVSALVTSLLKKIIDTKQDIRLHRTDFKNGYSAWSLDTKIVTPFFKKYFPKYANKESAFLTLATREKIKWNTREGNALKIRNKELKNSFLNIFNQVEVKKSNPQFYLDYLFIKLIKLSLENKSILRIATAKSKNIEVLNINLILDMLQKHFSVKLSSRLPVIAIYSIYQMLIPILKRYENKKLLPLQVHTSSDKHGFGDIEIYTKNNKPFEIVEIKHNLPIDEYLIFDIVKKVEKISVNRYYLLTTYKTGFENKHIEKSTNELIIKIKQEKNIDIIANGIITTLKYYLRFIDDYKQFIKIYTDNLVQDSKKSTEIKNIHIEEWINIMESNFIKL